ncbi:MAG: sigma-70 family RNA polymerase sigma factor, partial [Tannerella sp.]|nr:sigma-70 family RNA polymerase sigma factor [Tannerella sp.]
TYHIVYRFVHNFLPNKEDCEEVVSEVYYIIWKQRETLLDIENFKSWLYIVCRNEAFHYIKQKEKYDSLSIDDLHVNLLIDTSSVDGKLIEEEMLEIYNAAVAELPERCKLIFLMVREERLKYKEIAGILSISEGTIEQQMNIAIKKIVATVRKHYPNLKRRNKKS